MIDAELLKILCCPETHQPLTPADNAAVQCLNERITAGQARNKAGRPVTDAIEGGLLRQDGQILYPVRQGIPVLLVDEGILMR